MRRRLSVPAWVCARVSVPVSAQREARHDALFVGFESELSALFLQNGEWAGRAPRVCATCPGQAVTDSPGAALRMHAHRPHAHGCMTGKSGVVRPGVRAALAHELKKPSKEDTSLGPSSSAGGGGSGGSGMRLLSLSLLVHTLSLEPDYQGEYLVSAKTLSKGLSGTPNPSS